MKKGEKGEKGVKRITRGEKEREKIIKGKNFNILNLRGKI